MFVWERNRRASRRHAESAERRAVLLFAGVLLCGVLSSCATTVERVADVDELKLLAFLQAGSVARGEVEGRLGCPMTAYEDGRIVVYALQKNEGRFQAIPENDRRLGDVRFRLVLVYGPDGTMQRWSLVDRGSSR